MVTRVMALSDVHVDKPDNMAWLRALSRDAYAGAALILAGDVTDDLERLGETLARLRGVFAEVCFVPGNHELWVRRGDAIDSLQKFRRVEALCEERGVHMQPVKLGDGDGAVWIVPLLSWYEKPEDGAGSLFLPKEGEDPTLSMWSDTWLTTWPAGLAVSEHFLAMNEPRVARAYDAPVISFSHFLPRRDLIFSTPEERAAWTGPLVDPHPRFNFTRVAGSAGIETQVRRLGSAVHVYGHQHRNRDRVVDGVRYVSHCLGYPNERKREAVRGVADGPKVVWSTMPS